MPNSVTELTENFDLVLNSSELLYVSLYNYFLLSSTNNLNTLLLFKVKACLELKLFFIQ